jgi:predicted permease
LLLSIDEVVQLHESPNRRLRVALNAAGLLYHPWVILGAFFVLVIGMTYRRFLADLPAETRRLFLTAGTVFVSGALGVEALGGWYTTLYGRETMTYALIVILEELFEMVGVVVFIYSLMSYMLKGEKGTWVRRS